MSLIRPSNSFDAALMVLRQAALLHGTLEPRMRQDSYFSSKTINMNSSLSSFSYDSRTKLFPLSLRLYNEEASAPFSFNLLNKGSFNQIQTGKPPAHRTVRIGRKWNIRVRSMYLTGFCAIMVMLFWRRSYKDARRSSTIAEGTLQQMAIIRLGIIHYSKMDCLFWHNLRLAGRRRHDRLCSRARQG